FIGLNVLHTLDAIRPFRLLLAFFFFFAGKMPDHFAGTVEDIERDLLFSHGLEIVIDDCPRRRVVAHWLAFVEFLRVMQTECGLRVIKSDVCRTGVSVGLTVRREVVMAPYSADMWRT